MLSWVVDAALQAGVFQDVYVSTEDAEIAGLASSLGAVAHTRPDELAADGASSADVCLELAFARREQGGQHDALVCLQPTSPLLLADDVRQAWETFVDEGASFLLSVTPIDPHFFHWALEESDTGWHPFFGDRFMRDRLDLSPVFRPNGAIKIAGLAALESRGNFFGAPLVVHQMPEERSVHVAHEFDAKVAELVLVTREGS